MGLPEGDFVEAFLRANPAWLAEHPELCRVLEPPVRMHGEGLADHMAAMLRVQRERADGLLAAGRATAPPHIRRKDFPVPVPRHGSRPEPTEGSDDRLSPPQPAVSPVPPRPDC